VNILPRAADISREHGPYAYISQPLTGRPDVEAIKLACKKIAAVLPAYGLFAYLPFEHSDPILHSDIPNTEIYLADQSLTRGSALAIFYLPPGNSESFGVGGEMAFAESAQLPIIIMRYLSTYLSRKVQGYMQTILRRPTSAIITMENEDPAGFELGLHALTNTLKVFKSANHI